MVNSRFNHACRMDCIGSVMILDGLADESVDRELGVDITGIKSILLLKMPAILGTCTPRFI